MFANVNNVYYEIKSSVCLGCTWITFHILLEGKQGRRSGRTRRHGEWEIIEDMGTPQPNKSRLQKEYYILPVKVKKDTYYAIFYPLENEEDETAIKLGNPKCTTETCTEKELYNQKIEVSKKDWEPTEPRVVVIEIYQ